MVFTNGRIEIDLAPADVTTEVEEGLPQLLPSDRLEQLTDDQVRGVLEASRR